MTDKQFTRKSFFRSALGWLAIPALVPASKPKKFVEFRSYNLKPGTREHFHDLFVKQAMPLLAKWKIEVISYGASLHDQTSYYLVRMYDSVEHMQQSEDAFYGSDEWRKGPREDVIAQIENYVTVVVEMDAHTVEKLREMKAG